MKNLIAITFVAILGIGCAFAQPYVRATVGYGFAVGQTADGTDITVSANGDVTSKVNTYSLGGGLPLGIAGGYMFNENLGAELGINYLLGSKVETTISDQPTSNTTVETYTRQLRFNPALVFTSAREDLNVYGRVGLVIPAVGKTISDGTNVSTNDIDGDTLPDNVSTTFQVENKGKISLGYSAATGVIYAVSDAFEIFGEVELISLAVRKDTEEYTEYNQVITGTTGFSQTTKLEDRDERDNKTEFLTELVNGGNQDVTKPAQDVTSFTPFNKIGINVGIKYTFGN